MDSLLWVANQINLEFCYKNRTPGSNPTKCGLSIGNLIEVDLENKSQRAQPILTS